MGRFSKEVSAAMKASMNEIYDEFKDEIEASNDKRSKKNVVNIEPTRGPRTMNTKLSDLVHPEDEPIPEEEGITPEVIEPTPIPVKRGRGRPRKVQ